MKTTINYGIGTPTPEAHITRTKEKNRGRLKIYSTNTVYLDKGDEFELEIFNPTQNSVLATIEINGNLISNSGLVLKPAQRVYLERYFDTDKRFKFDVYEVENWEKLKKEAEEITNNKVTLDKELSLREQLLNLTMDAQEKVSLELMINELKTKSEEMRSLAEDLNHRSSSVQNATKFNGKVKILFYKEVQNKIQLLSSNIGTGYFGNGGLNSSLTTSGFGGLNSSLTTYGFGNINGSSLFSNTNIGNKIKRSKKSIGDIDYSDRNFGSITMDSLYAADNIETKDFKDSGRIEEGSISNQKFETINMNFESWAFHTTEYTLLPISEKPLEMKDLRRYCKNCGKKLSPSDIFCSSCGTKS